jgi:hypothetical protein
MECVTVITAFCLKAFETSLQHNPIYSTSEPMDSRKLVQYGKIKALPVGCGR